MSLVKKRKPIMVAASTSTEPSVNSILDSNILDSNKADNTADNTADDTVDDKMESGDIQMTVINTDKTDNNVLNSNDLQEVKVEITD